MQNSFEYSFIDGAGSTLNLGSWIFSANFSLEDIEWDHLPNILCCINTFTSLCKNLLNLLEFLAEAFRCHVHHFQCLTVPVELAAISISRIPVCWLFTYILWQKNWEQQFYRCCSAELIILYCISHTDHYYTSICNVFYAIFFRTSISSFVCLFIYSSRVVKYI